VEITPVEEKHTKVVITDVADDVRRRSAQSLPSDAE